MSNGESWSGVALSISIVPPAHPPPKARAAAARHPDAPQPSGRIGGKHHPAAERVGLRHAVQHQQRPLDALPPSPRKVMPCDVGWRRTAVRAAELLEPGDVGEDILQPLRGILRDPVAVDRHHVQRAVAGLVLRPRRPVTRWFRVRSFVRGEGGGRERDGEQRQGVEYRHDDVKVPFAP